MEINLRKALESDIETLRAFEQGVITTERPFDETLKAGDISYYNLLELIESNKAEVIVAVAGNELVGSGYAKILPAKPYLNHEEYAYLGFMYVKPDFRGQGINKKIIHKLIDWATSQNLTEVRLEVYDENVVAKSAYLKVGFKPNLVEMRLSV